MVEFKRSIRVFRTRNIDTRLSWTCLAVLFSILMTKTASDILGEECESVKITENPESSSVLLGNTINFTCFVENVTGHEVQWIKGGFAFGENSTLPGYPRYSMTEDAGRYYLIIFNASLKDEDLYRCQVTKCQKQSLEAMLTVLGSDILCSLNGSFNCDCVEISQGPADTSAVWGNSITLTCTVENVGGDEVQWTKGGVALGVDPNIPGYPRYSMAENDGNSFAGKYDLIISDVQLEDEDVYQCQVTKCNVQSQEVLLTVLVPPSGPIVIDEEINGEYRVIVDEIISIRCEAWNAKPPADVSWYLGNDQITEGVEKEIYSSETKLTNTSATITLTPSLHDDQLIYTCVMNNAALVAEDPSVIPARKHDICLFVIVLPLEPTIDGFDPSRDAIKVKEDEAITVTCRSNNGKPVVEMQWYRENDIITDNVDIEIEPPDDYGRQNVTSYLRIIGNASDDNVAFTCSSTNEGLTQPHTISFILDVSTSLSPGIIAAIVIGALVFLLLIIILILVICKRSKVKKATSEAQITSNDEVRATPQDDDAPSSSTKTSNFASFNKDTEISTDSSISESFQEGEINIAFGTELEESDEEDCSPPPQYSSPSSQDNLEDLPPDGDVFSLSSSLRRSDRGSPVDDFLQEDLEILSVPSLTSAIQMENTRNSSPYYFTKKPQRTMITNV